MPQARRRQWYLSCRGYNQHRTPRLRAIASSLGIQFPDVVTVSTRQRDDQPQRMSHSHLSKTVAGSKTASVPGRYTSPHVIAATITVLALSGR